MTLKRNHIECADALTYLRSLPDERVNCCVTSPPYFGLRDYGTEGQIGLEPTPAEYVAKLVEVLREVRRVLRSDGTAWINLGDSYSAGGRGCDTPKQQSNKGTGIGVVKGRWQVDGYGPKQLLGIPWRVAFGLQDDGWILRSDIIWAKNNPMPESVTDRPTKAHEYVFLLTKAPTYWYDAEAIREPHSMSSWSAKADIAKTSKRGQDGIRAEGQKSNDYPGNHQLTNAYHPNGRNKRSVWTVNTQATPEAHFATFPRKLIEPMILAGCPAQTCANCGAPYERITEREHVETTGTGNWGQKGAKWKGEHEQSSGSRIQRNLNRLRAAGRDHDNPFPQRITVGFQPTCTCNADTLPGVVLDPFFGSGTTALVARSLGRDYVGSELNAEYVSMANRRLDAPFTLPMLEVM